MADSDADDSGDNIKVFVRIRPPDSDDTAAQIVEVDEEQKQVIIQQNPNPKTFKFDFVADSSVTQECIFNKLGKKVIENCVAGYNGTIFAYGQTGSGKTYTMLGPSEEQEQFHSSSRGVIPRTFEYLYSLINREKELNGDEKQFLCKCSFLEIYNEQIFDLLEPNSTSLHLRESFKTGVYVAGLSERVVADAYEAYEVLSNSWMNRRVGATAMNRESSRSHAVFTLQVESKQKKGAIENIKTSQLHLVDLAGSERQKDTGATGQRLKEASSINKSLSNLGNVIMSLVTESKEGKKRYIPYRDSKLTFLLRHSLGGNSKTSLVACIHSGHRCIGETVSTLQFAKRAKMIKNRAIKNENAHGNVKELQAEIRSLKELVNTLRAGGAAGSLPTEVTVAIPDEAAHVLKKMFLQAMQLQQRMEVDKHDLLLTVDQLKQMCDRKDKAILSNKMILKFRDSTIKMLEGKMKGKEVEDTRASDLGQEIEQLRKQLAGNQDAARHVTELQRLQAENRSLRAEPRTLARVQEDQQSVAELEAKYHELVAEKEGQDPVTYITPQKPDAVSTATMEKLKSQVADLETQLNESKQKLVDAQQAAEKKELMLSSDLEARKQDIVELEALLEANKRKNQLQVAQINEKHLNTVRIITTPKKEKYRLRNRTVLTDASNTPDPLSTCLFDENGEELELGNEGLDEGILGEEVPEGLMEEDRDALLDELKKEQNKTASLVNRLATFESDIRKLSTQKTTVENQMAIFEELLEKEKRCSTELREDKCQLSKDVKKLTTEKDAAMMEVRDLKIVMTGGDKDFKALKLVNHQQKDVIDTMEMKMAEYEVTIKMYERVKHDNTILENELENEKERSELLENHGQSLSNEIAVAKGTIKTLEAKIYNAEHDLMEKQKFQESLLDQMNSEKQELYNQLMEKIDCLKLDNDEHQALQAESNMRQASLEKRLHERADRLTTVEKSLRLTEASLEKLLDERADRLTTVEKSLRLTEDKFSEQQEELHTYKTMVEQLQGKCAEQVELVESLQQDGQVADNFILSQKHELIEQQDKLAESQELCRVTEEKAKLEVDNLQSTLDSFKAQVDTQEEQIGELKTENQQLLGRIEKLETTIQSKEAATKELSSDKALELQSLTQKLDELESCRRQKNQENTHLKERLQEAQDNNDVLRDRLDSAQQDGDEARNSLKNSEKDLETYMAKSKAAEKRVKEREALLGQVSDEKNTLKKTLDTVHQDYEQVKRDRDKLTESEARLREVAEKDGRQKERLSAELGPLREAIFQIEECFPDSQGVGVLVQRIRATQERNEELEKENLTLAGHNNTKQKIKHVEQIKTDLITVKKDKAEVELKLRSAMDQIRHIEEVNKSLKVQITKIQQTNQLRPPGKENQPRQFFSGDFTSSRKSTDVDEFVKTEFQ